MGRENSLEWVGVYSFLGRQYTRWLHFKRVLESREYSAS